LLIISDIGDIGREIGIDIGYLEVGFPTTIYTKAGGGVIIPQSPLLLVLLRKDKAGS
jgi:hypothetical protein